MSGDNQSFDQAPSRRYVRSPQAKLKTVGETEALYVGESRALHVLNPTARLLFHCLDRPSTVSELVLLMERLTDASRNRLERDLDEVLPELERLGVVQRAE